MPRRLSRQLCKERMQTALLDMAVRADGTIVDMRTGTRMEQTPISELNPYHKVLWVWSPRLARKYGPKTQFSVHRLVAAVHVENPRPGRFFCVDHINRRKSDNRVVNLRWVSNTINIMNSAKAAVRMACRVRVGTTRGGRPILKRSRERGFYGVYGVGRVRITRTFPTYKQGHEASLRAKHALCEDRYRTECAHLEWDLHAAIGMLGLLDAQEPDNPLDEQFRVDGVEGLPQEV